MTDKQVDDLLVIVKGGTLTMLKLSFSVEAGISRTRPQTPFNDADQHGVSVEQKIAHYEHLAERTLDKYGRYQVGRLETALPDERFGDLSRYFENDEATPKAQWYEDTTVTVVRRWQKQVKCRYGTYEKPVRLQKLIVELNKSARRNQETELPTGVAV